MQFAGSLLVLLHEVCEQRGVVVEKAEAEFGGVIPAAISVTSGQRGETRADALGVGQLLADLLREGDQE